MDTTITATTNTRQPLIRRVIQAGGWATFGYALRQVIRFGSNLILTRLLFPEAFGLMTLVQAVLVGLALLSDVGIEQSIVQNRKGDSETFINTAWTAQIIRGALLWIVTCVVAIPFASLYGEPMLAQLLPVAGLTALIGGFASTNIALAQRDLRIGRVTLIELGSAIFTLLITSGFAWAHPSVWSLVIGNLAGAAFRIWASHVWLIGRRNAICWDGEALKQLSSFGRWVFVSSALTFLAGEGNRLLVGTTLDVDMLAFLTLATNIVLIPHQFVQLIGGQILFSAYSEVARERPHRLSSFIEKSRLVQIAPFWLACALLAYFGEPLVHVIYDERYHDAGWILQVMALGSLVSCLNTSYGSVLWAKGLVSWSTLVLAIQIVIQIVGMALGFFVDGPQGVVVALGLVSWILYPVVAAIYARLSLWQPKVDLPVIGLSILFAFLVLKYNLNLG